MHCARPPRQDLVRWSAATLSLVFAAHSSTLGADEEARASAGDGLVAVVAYDADVGVVPARQLVREAHCVDGGCRVRVVTARGPSFPAHPFASSPDLGAATAFVAATRVIDALESWAGHRIEWGLDGTLRVEVRCADMRNRGACYDRELRAVRLGTVESQGRPIDLAWSPDVTMHEAAHAAIHELKPGWQDEVSSVIHEGLADCIVFLTALGDVDVVERVIGQTRGDLRKPNEVSNVCERLAAGTPTWCARFPRRLHESESLGDFLLSPLSVVKLYGASVAGSRGDPHAVGTVVSSAIYAIFAGTVEENLGSGAGLRDAMETARMETGRLLVLSLAFMREHRVSVHCLLSALLQSDALLYEFGHAGCILREFAKRGVVLHSVHKPMALGRVEHLEGRLTLGPDLRDPEGVLAQLGEMFAFGQATTPVSFLAALYGAGGRWRTGVGVCTLRSVSPPEVVLDVKTTNGIRVVRVERDCHFQVDLEGSELRLDDTRRFRLAGDGDGAICTVYASAVFDQTGRLLALNADPPWDDQLKTAETPSAAVGDESAAREANRLRSDP